ncbi:MAG: hypothetical protein MZV64_14085 [Ignavibacteriales bacterium]|nr:hypothetical protein [Ignavibacteriales bacterium]
MDMITFRDAHFGDHIGRMIISPQNIFISVLISVKAGEEIGLFNADSVLVDSVSYGLQLQDVSMGRKPDGSANWFYFW